MRIYDNKIGINAIIANFVCFQHESMWLPHFRTERIFLTFPDIFQYYFNVVSHFTKQKTVHWNNTKKSN